MSEQRRSELARFRYWQGQMLRARDFRDQTRAESELRYWHNRALHNAYGISFGLKVSPVYEKPDDTNSPLVAVHISCGLAYDCFGRELILPSSRRIKIPSAPAGGASDTVSPERPRPKQKTTMTLAARYRESKAVCCSSGNELAAVCWPDSCAGLPEELELFWTRADCAAGKDGVPLARVNYAEAGRAGIDTEFVAPRARALCRPRTGFGSTIPGNTPWELWEVEVLHPGADPSNIYLRSPGMEKILIGMQTRIDTAAAGFTETPCYFATLEGQYRELGEEDATRFMPAFFTSITDASVDGFTFRLLMPPLGRQTFTAVRGFEVASEEREGARESVRVSVEFDDVRNLKPGSQVLLTGEDARRRRPHSVYAIVESIDASKRTARMLATQEAAQLNVQGGLRVASLLNESIRERFLSYARREQLYVCWLGCQMEVAAPIDCPERAGLQTLCT